MQLLILAAMLAICVISMPARANDHNTTNRQAESP